MGHDMPLSLDDQQILIGNFLHDCCDPISLEIWNRSDDVSTIKDRLHHTVLNCIMLHNINKRLISEVN